MDVDLQFLTGGVRYQRDYVLPLSTPPEDDAGVESAIVAAIKSRRASTPERLRAVLGHRDVSSRASIFRRYDGVVRGCTAIPPGFADAGVLVPIPGAPLGVAVAIGGNPRYGKIDPRRAAELAVVEAIAGVTAVGARPAGLTDCLNFGDPTIPEQMGQFVAAVDGLARAANALRVPFVSGNVSLYNRSSSGKSVAPSPIVSCIGTLGDISRSATAGFKRPGSAIILVGTPQFALGGSVIAELLGIESRALPQMDFGDFAARCEFVREAFSRNLVLAARDVSDGGPAAAIAEMAFASDREIGFWFDDGHAPLTELISEYGLFGEAPLFVLEVETAAVLYELAAEFDIDLWAVGKTIAEPIAVFGPDWPHGTCNERISIAELREAWEAPLRDFYGSVA
jgi:phosphoribosylformylglycinamidine synthase